MTHEEQRLLESRERTAHWKRWGPYLAEREWGTVREDYSPYGAAWDSFPRRLGGILMPDETGRRPVHGDVSRFSSDPHWRGLALFCEYFNGDAGAGLGASHQTGWTGLVAKLMQQSGERDGGD